MTRRLTLAGLAIALAACEQLPNVPPVASFVYSPVAPIFAGRTVVSFNASVSQDSDGRIVAFTWTFGDGSPEVNSDSPLTSHVFPLTGGCLDSVYTVLLTVADESGERGFSSQTVRVLPPAGAPECAGQSG